MKVLWHISAWGIFCVLDLLVNYIHYGTLVTGDLFLDTLLQLLPVVAITYLVRWYFFNRIGLQPLRWKDLGFFLTASLILFVSRYFLANRTFGWAGLDWLPLGKVFKNTVRDHAVVALAVCLTIIADWRHKSRALVQLHQVQAELQLQSILRQLQPHFLFNTLNNIYALIRKDPASGGAALMHLSKLLEYLVYQKPQQLVELKKELEAVHHYVELMRLKYGTALTLELSICSDRQWKIPVFFLLSLLENAFKHGGKINGSFGLQLEVQCQDENGRLQVRNTCSPKTTTEQGVGLDLLRKQLLLHQGKYGPLEVEKDGYWFQVGVQLLEV